MAPAIEKILLTPRLCWLACATMLFVALGLGESGFYLSYDEAFGLRNKDFEAAQAYLLAHLQPGDIIDTENAAYSYFLYTKDEGKTPHGPKAEIPYYRQTVVLAPFDSYRKPHTQWQSFRDALQARLNQHAIPPKGKIWFVVYNFINTEIWHLMECKPLAPIVTDFFSRNGVIIFSVRATDFSAFLQNTPAWEQCYADYKPFIWAKTFRAVQRQQ